jgi:hypothetical protein
MIDKLLQTCHSPHFESVCTIVPGTTNALDDR